MRSARGWARLLFGMIAVTAIGMTACEEDDAVFTPLVDETPPVVSVTNVQSLTDTLIVTVEAEDFIGISQVVTELRRTDQFEQIITADGDTIVLGRLLTTDTARTAGQVTTFTVTTTFTVPFTTPTEIEIRAVAIDTQGNIATTSVLAIVGGGTGGGGLGSPTVSIFSPAPGSTVRDNTIIRVGIRASDPTGLAQLNVNLDGAVTLADTIRFTQFRTDVDTLLDFFVPAGTTGEVTITAEAINLNTISAFATITVNVAAVVSDDQIPPSVSMLVTGGVERRTDEPLRMESDDSLLFNLTATDNETAITQMGVSVLVTNKRSTGDATATVSLDTTFATAISGTVPFTFALRPLDLPATVFTLDDIPDTLFMEVTGWALDAAATPNCGATVDPTGSASSLTCTGTTPPIFAQGVAGGFVERLIVAGRTVGFPQGSVINDAAVDTIRELLLLSDFNFGVVRPFDLANERFDTNVPVGSQPWGLFIDNTQDRLLVGNSGGTNISLVDLGARTTGGGTIVGEIDRFQTQDLKVYRVIEDFDAIGRRIFPVIFFEYSDRPQFLAQAANGLILYSTVPALPDNDGTIREYDPVQREIRFFIQYADRVSTGSPEIQVINADSVFDINGSRNFVICDHTRGDPSPAARSCIIGADSLADGVAKVQNKVLTEGWDVEIFSDLSVPSIGLQDTTFVAASGDREFIAFGEGDTPGRAGRIILYRSATQSITNSLQVSDLPGNAEQVVFGLALNNDGSIGVARGTFAYFFGPDQPGGPNVLRLLGINENISPEGTGAALHPDQDELSVNDETERLAFLGSGDARVELVDTHFFSFSRGTLIIRDPIVGPLRITRRLPADPLNVQLRLYGVTTNGVVVIPVKDSDIVPIP
ncbi:MAG: hypothetical protein GWN99_19015 [Gemmatimonadetes bacterium]|uniref:Uncharacterized protein n=1 Tax=Candidatus Kutchimonas denitrificans TaxID=3056748 RepID=A0AAE5C7R9_9BACT|nr:hypothetical protein [Gemmatimonadota bacterium]NIR73756.1 hypothetical protein [Candidatus Kutchimonas denitrificans]NIS03120.1 hypothetical protein [Gemmatimonadota bacterium]NIT69021.1 hypothetical protein [Gemmatimonadota bacterium]NIU54112.1 hypothetical protein [Gemmatimonadota bacterium]